MQVNKIRYYSVIFTIQFIDYYIVDIIITIQKIQFKDSFVGILPYSHKFTIDYLQFEKIISP